jgi:hypothetical protein
MSASKEYLGDAVYADVDEFGKIILTTEDGQEELNCIILEDAVIRALLRYIKKVQL